MSGRSKGSGRACTEPSRAGDEWTVSPESVPSRSPRPPRLYFSVLSVCSVVALLARNPRIHRTGDTIREHSIMPFKQVIGHRRVVALLVRSIDRGSLPPSLIFAGPVGAGRRRAATATAPLLNCTDRVGEPPDIDACGVCAACTRIARGVHSDVLVVE